MKVCMFHLMPYRDLPADFAQRYKSAYIDPLWFDVADPEKVSQYYNWTLDEFVYAARAGMHGLCTNQHHQNVYGFMANPSLMGSVLAKLTNGQNVAIIQLGSTLPSTSPPTRIAEEYALIDCISGGRLVAGFPTGLPTDATISNAVVPVEQRERYREALELVLKAWCAKDIFAWNGKHYQLPMVNLWPRPMQQPHPPIWIPGSGSATTVEFVVDRDDCFCHLSYYGAKNAHSLGDYFWETVEKRGRDANPYRLGFLQLIGVSETDAAGAGVCAACGVFLPQAPLYAFVLPGDPGIPGLSQHAARHEGAAAGALRRAGPQVQGLHRARISHRGKPEDRARSAPRRGEAAAHRASPCASAFRLHAARTVPQEHRPVLPRSAPDLQDLWDDQWEDRWWPERLRAKRPAAAVAANALT